MKTYSRAFAFLQTDTYHSYIQITEQASPLNPTKLVAAYFNNVHMLLDTEKHFFPFVVSSISRVKDPFELNPHRTESHNTFESLFNNTI